MPLREIYFYQDFCELVLDIAFLSRLKYKFIDSIFQLMKYTSQVCYLVIKRVLLLNSECCMFIRTLFNRTYAQVTEKRTTEYTEDTE